MIEIFSHALAGLTGEAISAFSYLPTDIVSQRLQTHVAYNFIPLRLQNHSVPKIISHIYKTEGFRGFFRGYWPYVAVYGPGSALWWLVYEAGKRTIDKAHSAYSGQPKARHSNKGLSWFQCTNYFTSGILAGVATVAVTNPLDVARTRLQLLEVGDLREKKALSRGFLTLLREIYQKEGVRGLYKGMKPRIWVRAPGSAISLLGYEYLKSMTQRAAAPSQNYQLWG